MYYRTLFILTLAIQELIRLRRICSGRLIDFRSTRIDIDSELICSTATQIVSNIRMMCLRHEEEPKFVFALQRKLRKAFPDAKKVEARRPRKRKVEKVVRARPGKTQSLDLRVPNKAEGK